MIHSLARVLAEQGNELAEQGNELWVVGSMRQSASESLRSHLVCISHFLK